MAHVAPIYPNFARGEVSPLMFGRIDIEQYPTCLDKCRNTYIRPYGCATRLTGTQFVSDTKNSGKVRLLKFVFSATDSYIIECGAGYFRFYQDGEVVLNNNDEPYEITNTYSEAQLDSIQYVQLDDIIKLTCLPDPNHPTAALRGNAGAKPKELIRTASNNWTFRDVDFKETPYLDQNTTNITLTPSAVTGNINLVASSAYFDSGMVGANFWIGTKVTDSETNKDVQGYVKITGVTDSTHAAATVQSKLSGTGATKLWGEGAFSDYRGYPAVVALYDGRLYYARTPHQPRNVYGSKPYAYETFTPAVDNEDDAGINIQLATNANGDGSDIKWMIGASYLLCGTYGGEFVIRGSGDGAITATDISARQRTNWGGEPVQPIVAGTFVHFLQRNGNKLRQFQYDFYYDSYKAVDVSIFSEHLLSSPIKEMALQKNPDSIIYLMREDGNVVMLTLEQDQSVQAWSLLEEMGAEVESIQTIPSYDGNYDEVYMVMKRQALSTTLSLTCSNPNLTVTSGYSGTKEAAGIEIETLKYINIPGADWDVAEFNNNLNNQGWVDIEYANNTFVALSQYGHISTSINGNDWTKAVKNTNLGSYGWASLAYGNGYFVALGGKNTDCYISRSVDGIDWSSAATVANLPLGDPFYRWVLTYGGNKFVAIRYDGYISTSTDGVTWDVATQNANLGSHNWCSVKYGDGKFIALGEAGYISTSTNGTTWSTAAQNISGGEFWTSLEYDGTKFVAIDYGGYISTSTNGTTWSTATKNQKLGLNQWSGLAHKNTGLLVAISSSGYISKYTLFAWQSQTTGNIVDITSSDYALSYSGTPAVNDTITLTYTTTFSGAVRYIERMKDPITPDNPYNWWYVRSGLKYDGFKNTEGINLSLSANSGTVTATASSVIFLSTHVGNRIRFVDDDYNILGEGEITAYTDSTHVTLKITTCFQSQTVSGGSWGISTDTISGLDHLDGRTVQIIGDGVEQENKTVVDGSIDVDDAFIIIAGLPYTSYITTMPMEAGSQNGTAVGKRKRISEMAIRVWNSLGVKVGRDLDHLYDTIYQQKEPFTGVIPNIKYNQGWVWDANITVEQSHPYPMNILSIAPIVTEVDK